VMKSYNQTLCFARSLSSARLACLLSLGPSQVLTFSLILL
jgi:hypothetical protein